MIAHRIEWLVVYEIAIANAEPKLTHILRLQLGHYILLIRSSGFPSPAGANSTQAIAPPY
jgi:hypothetical protein